MKKIITLIIFILYSAVQYGQGTETYTQTWNQAHGWHVMDVCFSPDGKRVLGIEGTVSANSIKLFDASTGEILWNKTASAKFGAFAPDMSRVYIAGSSTIAYNYPDGAQAWINNNQCASFCLSVDGSKIALGTSIDGGHGKVILLDALTGTELWQGTTNGPVADVKFNSAGTKIVSGGGDTAEREVIMWDAATGNKLWTTTHPNKIQTVSFAPGDDKIIAGTDWQKVYLQNALTGAVIWELTLNERFNDSGFSSDGTKVFLCQNNGYVKLFDVATGAQLWQRELGSFVYLEEMDLSPDGTKIAVAGADKYLSVLDLNSGSLLFRGLHNNNVMSLEFSRDGTRIATGTGYGGNVAVWQLNGTTSIETNLNIPQSFVLEQNYPNPFNPTTTIEYSLPYDCNVKVIVFNALGQKVALLLNKYEQAGRHSINWNGSGMSSGVYYYSIQTVSQSGSNNNFALKKMVLLK